MKSNFKKSRYDVILMTLSYYVTEKRHQNDITRFFYFWLFLIKISG